MPGLEDGTYHGAINDLRAKLKQEQERREEAEVDRDNWKYREQDTHDATEADSVKLRAEVMRPREALMAVAVHPGMPCWCRRGAEPAQGHWGYCAQARTATEPEGE